MKDTRELCEEIYVDDVNDYRLVVKRTDWWRKIKEAELPDQRVVVMITLETIETVKEKQP